MPASAKTSASPSFAQQMPTAPRSICRWRDRDSCGSWRADAASMPARRPPPASDRCCARRAAIDEDAGSRKIGEFTRNCRPDQSGNPVSREPPDLKSGHDRISQPFDSNDRAQTAGAVPARRPADYGNPSTCGAWNPGNTVRGVGEAQVAARRLRRTRRGSRSSPRGRVLRSAARARARATCRRPCRRCTPPPTTIIALPWP